jgi:hypothetical protein
MPETKTTKEAFDLKAPPTGTTLGQFQISPENGSHPRRVMTLEEAANMAVFIASDKASGMTDRP